MIRRITLSIVVLASVVAFAAEAGATFALGVGGYELVEGGFVDWSARLLGDRKERLLISGIGLELLARLGER